MAIMPHEIGKDLIQALGLPRKTREFTLHVRAGEMVRVECEYYPEDGKALTTALAQYGLVPRRPVAPAAPAVHFDTWYRHRINVAHARYMERTSYSLSCDWPRFSPEAIAAFSNTPGLPRYNR